MEKRLLVFDIGDTEIIAGAFVGDQIESVLRVPRDKGWEQWLEEFTTDHLATGPCTAVTSSADTALEKIGAKLKLDIQTVEPSPVVSGANKLHPGRNAIVIDIGSTLRFDAIVDGKVIGTIVADGIPPEPPELPESILSTTPEEQMAAGHYQRVLGTIERTVRLTRSEVPDGITIATGWATSELAIDPFSTALRTELLGLVVTIEPELRLIGIREALIKGK
jgi:hypothetical protein